MFAFLQIAAPAGENATTATAKNGARQFVVQCAVVWIDRNEARITHFTRRGSKSARLSAPDNPRTVRHGPGGCAAVSLIEDANFLDAVGDALRAVSAIVIAGPDHIKWELKAHIVVYFSNPGARIVVVEAAAHPSNRQLQAFARMCPGIGGDGLGAAT